VDTLIISTLHYYFFSLPVSFAAQASLGSLVAQAELGDYQPSENYAQLLSSVKIAQLTSEQEQFCNKVGDLHKLHRLGFLKYFIYIRDVLYK